MMLKYLDPRLWVAGFGKPPRLLKVGETAPSFTATAHDGSVVRSDDYLKKRMILWFFPAANTPRCTKQGCGFRDRVDDFARVGVEIFGVSFDSVEDNRKFAEHNSYPFKLLSDTSREMGVAYGAASTKNQAYAKRIAYFIDRGKIAFVYEVKDAADHAAQVLRDAKG